MLEIKFADFLGLLADFSVELLKKILHGLHLRHIVFILLIVHCLRGIFAVFEFKRVLKLDGAILELDDLLHQLLLIVALARPEDVLAGLAGLRLRLVGPRFYLRGFGVGVAAAVGDAHVFGDRGSFGSVVGA